MNDQTLTSTLRLLAEQANTSNAQSSDKERDAQLEGAIKDFDAFSYSISHDLRSSLRSINGFAKMLAEDKAESLDEEGREYLKIIRESALRMDRLMDDLLKLSRYNTRPLVKEKIYLNRMIADVMSKMNYTGDLNLGDLDTAFGDHDLIKEVWTHLVANAIKFTSKKSKPLIEIGMKQVEGETVYYVKDNGAGFDMKYAGRLFAIFQRMHNEKEFPGPGVGLAIVHRIISRHGGKIWADATKGEGATFYFTLSTT